jgi:hypothetical protein
VHRVRHRARRASGDGIVTRWRGSAARVPMGDVLTSLGRRGKETRKPEMTRGLSAWSLVSDWKMLPGPGRRLGPGSIAWVACLTSNQTGLRLQRCMLDVSNLYPTFLHCFNYYFMIVFLNHLTSLDAFDNTNARIR